MGHRGGHQIDMARRPHPYFGRLNRLEEARKTVPGRGRATVPPASPEREPGILWDRLRASPEVLTDSE